MNSDFLAKKRDRTIAIILRLKEAECDPYLPADVSARLRKVILDQVNEFYDMATDVPSGDVVLNDIYLQKLIEVHEAVVGNGAH